MRKLLAIIAALFVLLIPQSAYASVYGTVVDIPINHTYDWDCGTNQYTHVLTTEGATYIGTMYYSTYPFKLKALGCQAKAIAYGTKWYYYYLLNGSYYVECWSTGQAVDGDSYWVKVISRAYASDGSVLYISYWYPDFYFQEWLPGHVGQCGSI